MSHSLFVFPGGAGSSDYDCDSDHFFHSDCDVRSSAPQQQSSSSTPSYGSGERPSGATAAVFCARFNVSFSFLHFQAEQAVRTMIATATISFTLIVTYAAALQWRCRVCRSRRRYVTPWPILFSMSVSASGLRYCRSGMPQNKASDLGKTPMPSP
jgi:hypothetical protein